MMVYMCIRAHTYIYAYMHAYYLYKKMVMKRNVKYWYMCLTKRINMVHEIFAPQQHKKA
jgi:hypothetical protein